MWVTISFLLIFSCSLYSQQVDSTLKNEKQNDKVVYLNPELPTDQRVDDLVSRMSLKEKISQMINNSKAIPGLDIPQYNWWNEGLHGVARAGRATVFPQAIGLAATWNSDLMYQIADVISTEARAKYNDYIRKGEHDIYKGLTFWSPNINIFRDPRWGRGQETYGEDPFLTSRMGISFVKGLQGNDPKYFKVIATPKHYAVHSGPEPERHTFDAVVDNLDLYNTYLPAFKACIQEAGAYSIMCAYNRFLGDACCGSPRLLKKILRDDWGFKGYVVSDCGAIDDIFKNHKIVSTAPEASAIAVKSGTDLECGNVYQSSLLDAVNEGMLSEDDINKAVKRLFTARFKLGMFDPPEMVKYSRIPIEENDSEPHRKLSIRAAQESIVLLKNDKNILPLKKGIKKIAVIGPTADSYAMLLGNYNGIPSRYVTPLQGIKNKVSSKTEVAYQEGCDLIVENGIVKDLTLVLNKVNGKQDLNAEFFNNKNLEGNPYLKAPDLAEASDWAYRVRVADTIRAKGFSVRWNGTIKVPESGEYTIILKGNDGYRFYVDDKLLIEDWTEHKINTKTGKVHLEKDKIHNIKIEYFLASGRPHLYVQYELMDADYPKRAVDLAKKSDVVIFIGGITAQLEGEEMPVDYEGFKGGDRTSLNLPRTQENLLKMLKSTGKPVILVLTSGSALSVNWENKNIPAILQLWYPGEEGGTALADVLFGDYNPGGRLPITYYKSVDQLPPFEDYEMKDRTYRYFKGEPLFPFGYGLSYSKFKYSKLVFHEKIKAGDSLKVSVEVKNIGKVSGDEVVELYIKDMESSLPVPIHSLQGFKRINLQPGEKKAVEFILRPEQLAIIKPQENKEKVKYVIEPGNFEISVGGLQPGTKAPTTEYITKRLKVTGEPFEIR